MKNTYFENLDALRFFCFLSVFFYHSFDTSFGYIRQSEAHQFVRQGLFEHANLGVNFFFVLSGFLITYLLIEEKKQTGQISLPRFWMRRILRIWPLFYLSVFFGFVIFPLIKIAFGQIPTESASLIYYLTFLNNFDVLAKGTPDASTLGALWSVAVEEQFYLLWPLILYVLPLHRYWIAFALVIGGSLAFRAFSDSLIIFHFHTLSCIGDMAIGSLGAWLMAEKSTVKRWIENLATPHIIAIYVVFAVIYFFRKEIFFEFYPVRIVERSLIALVMLLMILEQCYSRNSLFKFARLKSISNLGTISYGLYCFHFVGILIAKTITHNLGWNQKVWQVLVLDTSLALIATVVISKISYQYLELPFLRLKERYAFGMRHARVSKSSTQSA
jgi:peptidoglycan/LPS O-acetylase OafA/YrhL